MISSLKNYRKLLIAALVVILAIASVVVLDFTKPYAVYAKSGKKVEDPYAVKAGGEELFLVKDEKTAEKVIEKVLNEYTPDGAQVVSVSVDKKLSTGSKSLKRSEEPPVVLTEKESRELYTGAEQHRRSAVFCDYRCRDRFGREDRSRHFV